MKPLLRAQEQLDAYRVAFDAKHKPATLPHIDATSSQPAIQQAIHLVQIRQHLL